ncbi:MAG: hypothetical protein LBI15_07690 [Dysgonamonadaceae bacterium]|jgi:NADH:ubiquinone oxidoreductase subunit 3 (subunit A)|nr:hypothetical protein [Dysgonamonadaceae bacterium]
MDNNLLTAYSFLAALTENETDIYKTVYLPLCKRAVSLYAKNHKEGTDEDIQQVIEQEYGISVPILVVRKLLNSIVNDLSRKEQKTFHFRVFENGQSFQFESFNFDKVEEVYEREKRRANALQTAFEDFIKKEESEFIDNIPSFADFIDKNKQKLSSFFAGTVKELNGQDDTDNTFMPHIDFLLHIEKNYHELYKTAEQIFLGSIIAAYLEADVNLDVKIDNGIAYYLDTQIILEALDLQKAEDTQPTLELLKLIKETGGRVRVLDITIDEVRTIIQTAINNYDKNCPTTTVNAACVRIGKNKTWLISINGRLNNFISDTLKVDIDKVPTTAIEQYSNTEDVNLLKKTRLKKNSATHDVIAYLYVRHKRKSTDITFIQKATYWFITANESLANFNMSRKLNGYINEIIMPEELTSLLFLKNPQKLYPKVSKIGLNELIAQTLSEEYASKELINEFDSAVQANLNISKNDYEILLSSIALESNTKLQRLLMDANDTKKFNQEIHKRIEKTRTKRSENEKEKIDSKEKQEIAEQNSKELAKQLSDISSELEQIRKESEKEKEQRKQEKELRENEKKEEQKRRKLINSRYILVILVIIGVAVVLIFPDIITCVKKAVIGVTLLSAVTFIASMCGIGSFILSLCDKRKK